MTIELLRKRFNRGYKKRISEAKVVRQAMSTRDVLTDRTDGAFKLLSLQTNQLRDKGRELRAITLSPHNLLIECPLNELARDSFNTEARPFGREQSARQIWVWSACNIEHEGDDGREIVQQLIAARRNQHTRLRPVWMFLKLLRHLTCERRESAESCRRQ